MHRIAIDERGWQWDPQSWQFRARLFVEDTNCAALPLAIHRLGFVSIAVGHRVTRIDLNPALISRAACAALYLFLRRSEYSNFSIHDARVPHFVHACRDATSAIRMIGNMIADAQYGSHHRFRSQKLAKQEAGPLGELVDVWLGAAAVSREAAMLGAVAAYGMQRFMVLKRERPMDDLKCEVAGSMPSYPGNWGKRLVGLPVRHFPDTELAQWASAAYRSALRDGSPLLERITAHVIWPEAGQIDHQYRRAILPLHDARGVETLLVAFA